MSESNNPSKKRGNYSNDTTYIPYSEMSQYLHNISGFQMKGSTKMECQTPTRINDRFCDTQRSINTVIDIVSSKLLKNREAIEEVKSVNQEIAANVSRSYPVKLSPYDYKNRTCDRSRDESAKDYIVKSRLYWQPKGETKINEEDIALSSENAELRERLNAEMNKNNDLLRYAKTLESENASLRSTQLTTTNNPNSVLQNRWKTQLSTPQNNQSQFVPGYILSELGKLKEESSLLRRDTMALLRSKQRAN